VQVSSAVVSLREMFQERTDLIMTMTPTTPSMRTSSVSVSSDALTQEALGLKLTCKQPDLARGLSLVSRAVLSHSTLPILTNILVATDCGRLRLSATNLEIGIQVWVDAHIEQEGTTALPADLIAQIGRASCR